MRHIGVRAQAVCRAALHKGASAACLFRRSAARDALVEGRRKASAGLPPTLAGAGEGASGTSSLLLSGVLQRLGKGDVSSAP